MFAVHNRFADWASDPPGGLRPAQELETARQARRMEFRASQRATVATESDGGLKGIVKFLEKELAIRDDGRFRGSVVNLIGVPGGPVMDRLGVPEEEAEPFDKSLIEAFDGCYKSFDPHLSLAGLWDLRIPTLENNNHMVTPPFHFLTSRVLSRPQDYHSAIGPW